jgi:hypothetical protein
VQTTSQHVVGTYPTCEQERIIGSQSLTHVLLQNLALPELLCFWEGFSFYYSPTLTTNKGNKMNQYYKMFGDMIEGILNSPFFIPTLFGVGILSVILDMCGLL